MSYYNSSFVVFMFFLCLYFPLGLFVLLALTATPPTLVRIFITSILILLILFFPPPCGVTHAISASHHSPLFRFRDFFSFVDVVLSFLFNSSLDIGHFFSRCDVFCCRQICDTRPPLDGFVFVAPDPLSHSSLRFFPKFYSLLAFGAQSLHDCAPACAFMFPRSPVEGCVSPAFPPLETARMGTGRSCDRPSCSVARHEVFLRSR